MARINYVELPVADADLSKAFYEAAFDWQMTDFGPTYAATMTSGVDLGLQGDATEATRAPLAVIAVEGLDDWPAKVTAAGGTITRPIFAFPGGRRFHFTDPSGNELAVVEADH
ncbi:MAG TPA: VOC family protein [Sphingomonas sp.]|nr:VOC family protein [Sphingomonas sp.]